MLKTFFRLFVLCGVISVLGWAYLDNQDDLERIAMEHGLDAEQTAAFKACAGHMAGKSLSLANATYSRVPREICVCQSRSMVAVFRSGEYRSHENIVDYLSDDGPRRPLDQSQLQRPESAEGDFTRLADSLMQCTMFYHLESTRRNQEALQAACKELERQGSPTIPSQCADLRQRL